MTECRLLVPRVELFYRPADSAVGFLFCWDGDEHPTLVLLAAILNNSSPQCHEWRKAYVAGREDALQTIEPQYRGVNPGKRGADNPSNCPGHLVKLWGHRSGPEYATLSLREPKPEVFFCPIFLRTMSPLKCNCLIGGFKWGILYTHDYCLTYQRFSVILGLFIMGSEYVNVSSHVWAPSMVLSSWEMEKRTWEAPCEDNKVNDNFYLYPEGRHLFFFCLTSWHNCFFI